MNINLILTASVLLFIIVVVVSRRLSNINAGKAADLAANKDLDIISLADTDNKWWIALNKVNQLELALFLCGIALPVWEKYTSSDTTTYTDTSSMLPAVIDKDLLATSLNEVKAIFPLLPESDHKKVTEYYNDFIGPVVALQDGDWVPPYAVKKIFLSCYNILKGIAENDKTGYHENFFAVAIDQLLDCIDISKLYSKTQVNQLLSDYKFLL